MEIEKACEYVRDHKSEYEDELRIFCRIPSISTLPEHKSDLQHAAEWLCSRLGRLGADKVAVIPTSGNPVVYGELQSCSKNTTVLVYGHYDVQPADPLSEWISPPFEPQIRENCLYARGASDMKAQIVAVLAAIEALKKTCGDIPCTIKFLFEGEEEIGSPSLPSFIDKNKDLFKCDVVLNCDGGIHGPETPSITYGLRGLAYFELEIQGPKSDLHSGVFGGTIENPAIVLCRLIAGMIRSDGVITLPGFYEDVEVVSDEERAELARLPILEEEWLSCSGAPQIWGEKNFTIAERLGVRPSLDVNGLWSGFTGKGSKTVLPARAVAKLSMRLVPNQRGEKVESQLRAYLTECAPPTVRWCLTALNYAVPVVVNRNSVYMRAAAAALKKVFQKQPLFKRDGGTIPVVGIVKEKLGVDSVLLGFELPDAGFHGPNEKMHLPTFHRGIETYLWFFKNIAGD